MIDYNQFSKKISISLGLFFFLLGIAGFTFAAIVYTTEITPPDSKLHMQKTLTECLDIAKSKSAYTGNLDFNAEQLKIQKYGLENGKRELVETINIVERCNDVVLQEFCVGLMDVSKPEHGCEIGGVQFILKYKSPWSK